MESNPRNLSPRCYSDAMFEHGVPHATRHTVTRRAHIERIVMCVHGLGSLSMQNKGKPP